MNVRRNRNMERRRADYLFREISEWKNKSWRDTAVEQAKGLPVELRAQGLIVTIAKLKSKRKEEADRIATLLSSWLVDDAPTRPWNRQTRRGSPETRLLDLCKKADRRSYQWAQTEALALLELLKLISGAWYGKTLLDDIDIDSIAPSDETSRPLDELRAGFILKEVIRWGNTIGETVVTRAKSLPMEILNNGLIVTLANLLRAKDRSHLELAIVLAAWLLKAAPRKPMTVDTEKGPLPKTLFSACITTDAHTYQAMEAEALATAGVIKAYATALYNYNPKAEAFLSENLGETS